MSNALILSLGWALLHSFWQIGLLGLCALSLERLLRHYSAKLRHQIMLFMLGGMVLACVVTLFQEWQHFAQAQQFVTNPVQETLANNKSTVDLALSQNVQMKPLPLLLCCKIWVEARLYWFVTLWLLGIFYFSLRFSWNYRAMKQLYKQSSRLEDAVLLGIIGNIHQSLGLRKMVRFYIHPTLCSPLTFGYFRPVVLLPAALICQVQPDLLEALVRHELIHVRRSDFLINLFLSLTQILFFYHPMIWVITRRIQELREEACDASVVASGCNNLIYAEALIQLQRLHHHQNIPLVMQAQNHSSHFAWRVKQILRQTPADTASQFLVPKSWLGSCLGIAFAIILTITAIAAPQKQPGALKPISSLKSPVLDAQKAEVKPISLVGTTEKSVAPQKKQQLKLIPTAVDTPPAKPSQPELKMVTLRDKTLFLGENTINVTVSGVLAEQIKLSSANLFFENLGKGQFKTYASQTGKVVIRVTTPDYYWDVEFLVILPDPVATLGGVDYIGGSIPLSTIRASKGIEPKLPPAYSNDYANVECEILGFNCIYIPREKDPIQLTNPGGAFLPKALDLVQAVNVNDQIIFDNIRAKCPGDEKGRKINNIAFKIIADPEKKE
jgi:beta-lactamase regulating signal transducer with metallopeptidase domain